jgi:hypothetical protein
VVKVVGRATDSTIESLIPIGGRPKSGLFEFFNPWLKSKNRTLHIFIFNFTFPSLNLDSKKEERKGWEFFHIFF